ncbi:hypothetical protein BGZ63DRAFT_407013 [Mariannaea sp. PMI_226]|nr:hypothetical protein BGZ63DRAFT_407013 [Mariannaea sp. PMI_226]
METERLTPREKMITRPPETHGGVLTSWLPMSTAWPSCHGCPSSLWEAVPNSIVAWDPGYGLYVKSDLHCLPPEVTSWWEPYALGNIGDDFMLAQFSLGPVVCPEVYTTLASKATVVNSESRIYIACCPSSYTYRNTASIDAPRDAYQCASDLTAGQVIKYMTLGTLGLTYNLHTSTLAEASVLWAVQVQGWLFPRASTEEISPIHTSFKPTSSTAAKTISTAEKAAIGVGAGLAVLGLAAVSGMFLFRRRKRKSSAKGTESEKRAESPAAQLRGGEAVMCRDNTPNEVYGSLPKDDTPISEMPEVPAGPVELR